MHVMRTHWVDSKGKKWRVPAHGKRLQFSNLGPATLRAFVFDRDGYKCLRCGWMPEHVPTPYDGHYTLTGPDAGGKRRELQLDHVTPISRGGDNHPDNFQTLCFGCNAAKRDRQ